VKRIYHPHEGLSILFHFEIDFAEMFRYNEKRHEKMSKRRKNMENETRVRRSPSRADCEKMIKRILRTEVLEKGRNTQFRNAMDFMNYFESLYPASPGLTKQVQRAVKALDIPKDENGFFIINKTGAQMAEEQEIRALGDKFHVDAVDLSGCESVFLTVPEACRRYLCHLLLTSITFSEKLVTVVETGNGLLLYTKQRDKLMSALQNVLFKDR
jgi:hypothetical protein